MKYHSLLPGGGGEGLDCTPGPPLTWVAGDGSCSPATLQAGRAPDGWPISFQPSGRGGVKAGAFPDAPSVEGRPPPLPAAPPTHPPSSCCWPPPPSLLTNVSPPRRKPAARSATEPAGQSAPAFTSDHRAPAP